MFSPKAKSNRLKNDAANGTETKSTARGLLSFNTSNFTKIFKNPTNFVQTTFGTATASSTVAEQEETTPFTVPRTNISPSTITTLTTITTTNTNPCAPNKNLISNGKTRNDRVNPLPSASPAKYSSPLNPSVNHGSPKITGNGDARTEPTTKFNNFSATSSFVATTISGRNNEIMSSPIPQPPINGPKTFISATAATAAAATTKSTDMTSKMTTNLDSKSSLIIFETVKLNRIPPLPSKIISVSTANATSENSSPKRMSNNSSSNANHNPSHNQMDTNASNSIINRSCAISKTISSTTATSATNATNYRNEALYRSRSAIENSEVGLKAFDRNAGVSFDYVNQVSNINELGRNGNVINANNAIRSDFGCGGGASGGVGCKNANNNIDYNLQHCIEQIEASSAFETNANKLDHFATLNYHPIAIGNAVEHDTNRSNFQTAYQLYQQEHYQQQQQQHHHQTTHLLQMNANYTPNEADGNKNVIASMSSGGTGINTNINNNPLPEMKKMTNNGCNDATGATITTTTTLTANSTNIANTNHTNSGNNNTIVTNKYNQNFILSKSMELHDIQEELYAVDEEDNYGYDPFVVRSTAGKGWNSLPVHKYANYHGSSPLIATAASTLSINNNFSAASFGAACSATILSASNRNPFLQLTASTSPIMPSSTSSFLEATSATSHQPPMTPSTVLNNSTCTAFATTGSNIFAALRYGHTSFNGDNDNVGDDNDNNDQHQHQQQQISIVDEQPNELDTIVNLHSDPITPEAMHTLQLFFRQHGTEYIKEFLQVINIFSQLIFQIIRVKWEKCCRIPK